MNIDLETLKALELKLVKYTKVNGAIAEHESVNKNRCNGCVGTCLGMCTYDGCGGSCAGTCSRTADERNLI